jgi:hypothetical protein
VQQGDSAASMEERWRGILGTSGVDAAVLRRMTLRKNSLVRFEQVADRSGLFSLDPRVRLADGAG